MSGHRARSARLGHAASWCLGLGALAVALGAPGVTRAQVSETCVLLPPPETAEAPATVREAAETALAAGLRERGLVVLGARDAQLRMMGQPMEHCATIDCAPDVNRFLGTSMAVLLELTWVRGRVTALHVALVGLSADRSVGGQAELERGSDVAEAVRAALGAAWDRWEADRQGQLMVTSVPEGAFVELDGASVGRAPVRRLVPAGIHSLRVTLEGYATDTREITIDRHEEREVVVELRAADMPTPIDGADDGATAGAASAGSGAPGAIEDRAHWANWLLGGALVLGSAALAIRPLDALVRSGENVAGPGEPPRYVVFDAPLDGTLLGLSIASLLGGVAILALQPIRETVTVEARATSLRLTVTF